MDKMVYLESIVAVCVIIGLPLFGLILLFLYATGIIE